MSATTQLTTPRATRLKPSYVIWLVILVIVVLLILVPEIFATHDPLELDLPSRLLAPTSEHFFGTDDFGRDIYSRVVHGARFSMVTSGIVVLIGVIIGSAVGMVAGYARGWVDEVLMRLTDIVLAFPPILLAMVIVTALGPNLTNTVLTLIVISWPEYARVVRAQTLVTMEQEYVLAAMALGIRPLPLLWRHILPSTLPALIVQATLNLGVTILALAALGFLGLGAQPPQPEWGLMVSNGRNYFLDAWWYPVFPGFAIALITLTVNILGDNLRDRLDPLE